METKRYKVNIPMRGTKKGQIIALKIDRDGKPVDQFWRMRLVDAEIDNCIEPFEQEKPKRKYTKKSETIAEDIPAEEKLNDDH